MPVLAAGSGGLQGIVAFSKIAVHELLCQTAHVRACIRHDCFCALGLSASSCRKLTILSRPAV
jgi:hypothetical protein